MKTLTFVLIGFLGCGSICEAGGFFRRVPEVGEWARYDLVMLAVATLTDENAPAPGSHESTGSLTLKCVGEEAIDDVRHLWIESRIDVSETDVGDHWMVLKVLVPADQVTHNDLTAHVVRGWAQREDAEVSELTFEARSLLDDPYSMGVMLSFPVCSELEARDQNKTLAIGDDTVRLTQAESGEIEVNLIEDSEVSGEITLWPSADHAFGIAAGEQLWTMEMNEPIEMSLEYGMQMDLVETGTGAMSDLPENN